MLNLMCPICSAPLEACEKSYVCPNSHSFDRAKSGYVNLLMSQKSAQKRHGDDKLMANARQRFLDGGFYNHLLERVRANVLEHAVERTSFLDAGCGECFYCANIFSALEKGGFSPSLVAIDISKDVLIKAAGRFKALPAQNEIVCGYSKNISLAAASIYKMPVADESCDIVLNIFAPHSADEYSRVLKSTGYLIKVIPLEKHLWELKKAIYDDVYENEIAQLEYEGFELEKKEDLKKIIHLSSNQEIEDLFMMTPYYYKTSENDQKKLSSVTQLDVTTEFSILVYKKI